MLPLDLLRCREDVRVIVAKLEETLHPSARMFRALAIVPVGQARDEATALQPLTFPRSNELVDDALSVVCEIFELRFPDRKEIRRNQRVTQLKTKRPIFR